MSSAAYITPEELMAGGRAAYDVDVPAQLWQPGDSADFAPVQATARVRLRPLTVKDIQIIAKAAKDDDVLTSMLMIQRSMVEPAVKQSQVAELPGGLVAFLVDKINRISGLTTTDDQLLALRDSPLVQAFFVLAREFNWTPDQVRTLTVGQILGYLEMLNVRKGGVPK
ncbi:hypothetical protein QCE73_37295 [Caballeronia sp. LZ029]|uniref:hypothetical protein n=1 Tax=Caballeronia sp. LZ029 TaxID=3038564 RepID=UPI00285FFAEB|nr:hypothetical protein [Caballeronia sp. LZ029]MDR5748838.1 hypothetical protein [Caballeronia sp. LZ029]